MSKERKKKRTRIKEHISNSRGLLVNFEGMACKDNPLGNDPGRIRVQETTHSHKMWGYEITEQKISKGFGIHEGINRPECYKSPIQTRAGVFCRANKKKQTALTDLVDLAFL